MRKDAKVNRICIMKRPIPTLSRFTHHLQKQVLALAARNLYVFTGDLFTSSTVIVFVCCAMVHYFSAKQNTF